LKELPEKMQIVLETSKEIEKISENFLYRHDAIYLGRGPQFPIALEGALKLKEVSYIHAEGYPAAEMKHGPIALVDKNMPVIFIAVKDRFYKKILSNIEEVKSRGGFIIIIANNDKNKMIEKLTDIIITIPEADEFLMPMLTVVPLQLLAYHSAVKRNCDVDKPRNLAKSVTVE